MIASLRNIAVPPGQPRAPPAPISSASWRSGWRPPRIFAPAAQWQSCTPSAAWPSARWHSCASRSARRARALDASVARPSSCLPRHRALSRPRALPLSRGHDHDRHRLPALRLHRDAAPPGRADHPPDLRLPAGRRRASPACARCSTSAARSPMAPAPRSPQRGPAGTATPALAVAFEGVTFAYPADAGQVTCRSDERATMARRSTASRSPCAPGAVLGPARAHRQRQDDRRAPAAAPLRPAARARSGSAATDLRDARLADLRAQGRHRHAGHPALPRARCATT